MDDLAKIGAHIAALRRQRGLTQEDLAGLIEMDRSYLSEIETGRKNLSVLSLIRLAGALDAKPGKMLDQALSG